MASRIGRAHEGKVLPAPPKALVFDVFGTVVDWRTSVAREVEDLAKRKGLRVDGAALVWEGCRTRSGRR
jgi:hypothetical protein